MSHHSKQNAQYKINERKFVELPLLAQLEDLGWDILDLDRQQKPTDTFRDNFTEVVMLPILYEQIQVINPWLESDQIDEVIKHLTASFPTNSLLTNNQHAHTLLLENTSVSENRQTGAKSPTVRFIDFDDLTNNRFIAVCQFKIRILGTEHHIFPDIVLFVNGLPLVVIECKSPKANEPIPEAIDQMLRYSEQRGELGEGSPPLFFYNHFIVATSRNHAKFGTITTHNEKHFYRWADPHPRSVNDLEHGTGAPNDQQRLVAGMMDKRNLLDLLRTFTFFTVNEKGQLIKIVARYQQFRAVKLAVARLLTGATPQERSGIIWHTQGSGKSLTMMFMVREMYRHPQLSQWKIVFVTDRTQLEEQLTGTGQGVGYTVKVADSINNLKELLRSQTSDLVMAMIQKFQDPDLEVIFPKLNDSPNILVMVDEAHRSQYAKLGANLDRALPNRARIGYTGTPIDKTERVFGDYIDKYTIRQSITDGVTLEIVYEGRTHNAEVTNQPEMDKEFADVFSEYNLLERLQILGYGSRRAYLEAEPVIAAKAQDMVQHYLKHVFPNGYKAQIVTTSREAAVRYKTAVDDALSGVLAEWEQTQPNHPQLDRLRSLQSAVIISGRHNDLPHIKAHTDKSKHASIIKSFKLPFDGKEGEITGHIGIVIVTDMLLTGFDAPLEQVMYMDKVIIAHNMLQAIARVNRVAGSDKEKGFVVDYVGIGHHLKRAIDNYDEREQKEVLNAFSFPEEELNTLENKHKEIMALLAQNGLTDLTDYDAFFDAFYDEELRFAYTLAYKQLTHALNLVYPAKEALDYLNDYQVLTEINWQASQHFRDQTVSMKGIPAKLRVITDTYLASCGIEQKVKPISILDDKFEDEVGKRKRTQTKAATIEHAIRDYIDVELIDDPDLQISFSEAMEEIFRMFKDNWEKIYQELEKLRQKIRDADKEPTYGLHKKKQMPFFRRLKGELYPERELSDDEIAQLVDLTQQIFLVVERELKLTGFWESLPARQKLRAEIQEILLSPAFNKIPDLITKRKQIISRVMEIAEKNNDRILYAE